MKPEQKAIIKALTDPDPEVRDAAHEDLFIEIDDELALAIVAIATGNAAEEIREEAIVALGPLIEECGSEYRDDIEFEFDPDLAPPVTRETFREVVKQVRAIYNDGSASKLLRRRALEVLVRDPQPWQSDEVRRHFASGDEEWRLTAIFAMGWLNGFDRELLEAVKSSSGNHLIEAVRAAGDAGLTSAAPRIRELAASDKTERVLRLQAIQALPFVDEDSFELLEELSQSKRPEIAEAAEDAIDELVIQQRLDDEFDEEDEELDDEE